MAETSPGSPFQYIPIAEGLPVRKKRDMPDGLWMRCDECESTLFRKAVAENMEVCPECGAHFRIGAARRLEQLADPETFEELFGEIAPADPLGFEWRGQTYAQRIRTEQDKTAGTEAVLTGEAYIRGRRVALGIMDGDFLMGSMGSVVGEKIALLIEHAGDRRLPLVIVSMSGGARMHEGALSVMQMGKTAAALGRLDDRKGLFLSVLAGPPSAGRPPASPCSATSSSPSPAR